MTAEADKYGEWVVDDLWKIDNYRAFLQARRELLAQAANEFHPAFPLRDAQGVEPLLVGAEQGGVEGVAYELKVLEFLQPRQRTR